MSRRRTAALLGAGAAAYAIAAWTVPPGFYDAFNPAAPYRWVSPPPSLRSGNRAPLGGHATDPVLGGSGTAPLTAFTGDAQVVISFVPDSFQVPPGQQSVTVDIKPVATYPATSFSPATNVYLITASAPLKKQALVELTYSNSIPAPSYVYQAPETGGPWRNLGSSQVSAVYSISTRTSTFGYFAGGYPARSKPPPGAVQVGGGQVLPIVVAAIIVLVLVAGVPLALLRRRRDEEDEEDEE